MQERNNMALRGLQGQAEKVPMYCLWIQRPLSEHFEKACNKLSLILLHRHNSFY
jgi:hypothetical protein